MRILLFGDLHASDKAPLGRVDDYREAILKKVAQIGAVAKKFEVTAVISAGDIFHQKHSNRVSDYLRQELIREFKEFECPVFVVPGNHDMGPDELNSLTRQPLGTLARAGAVEILTREIRLSTRCLNCAGGYEPPRIGTCKCTKGESEALWIFPRPYHEKGDAEPAYYALTPEEESAIETAPAPVVMVAHGSVLPPKAERPYPYCTIDQIPGIERVSLFFAGHIHENLGFVHHGNTLYCNLGSVGRVARHKANYMRDVQVALYDTEEGIRPIKLTVAPAAEVFGAREVNEVDSPASNNRIAQFVEQLGEGLRADELSIDELIASTGGDMTPQVRSLVRQLLEEAQ